MRQRQGVVLAYPHAAAPALAARTPMRAPFTALQVASLALPFLLAIVFSAWIWRQVEADAHEAAARTAELLHEQVARAVEVQDAIIAVVRARIEGMGGEEIAPSEGVATLLTRLDEATPITSRNGIFGPAGTLVAMSRAPPPGPRTSHTDRDIFAPLSAPGQDRAMLGRPVVGRTSRDRVFPYARPHLGPDGQSTGGVIWTTFLPDSFAAMFQRIALHPQDTVMLVRADGVVLPRYPWIDLTELTALAPEDPPMRSVADAVARADAEAMLRQSQRVEVLGELPPWIAGHPAELDSALMNLVLNARDAMPAGGEITIALRPTADAPGLAPGHSMEMSVSDRGMGMDADTLARATEAFFTTKPVGGTGLGLSSIRGFVDGAGGTMQRHSTPGQGTTVTLWLPEAPESPA